MPLINRNATIHALDSIDTEIDAVLSRLRSYATGSTIHTDTGDALDRLEDLRAERAAMLESWGEGSSTIQFHTRGDDHQAILEAGQRYAANAVVKTGNHIAPQFTIADPKDGVAIRMGLAEWLSVERWEVVIAGTKSLHRLDGPAIVSWKEGNIVTNQWYLFGHQFAEETVTAAAAAGVANNVEDFERWAKENGVTRYWG